MMYVGIDVGKNNHEMGIVDDEGNHVGSSLPFPNTVEGAQKMLQYLKLMNPSNEDVLVCMESTGHYWLSLYSFLQKEEYETVVVNPLQSDSFRKLSLRKTKTDPVDSFLLADLIRFGKYSNTTLPNEKTHALRQLSRFRTSLVETCSDCKRQAIAVLDQVFPEYASLFSDVFGKTSQEILLKYTTPEEILSVDTRKLTYILSKASRGRLGKDKARALKKAAKISFGIVYAQDAFPFQLKMILRQIQFMETNIKEVEEKMVQTLKEVNNVITTIPGVGPILGAAIVGEIGDIKRFSDCNKLVAFAGLDPSVKQSGSFTGTKNHISKRGSRYLRRAIWLAAVVAAFHDPVFSAYYLKKRGEGKAYGTSIGAVARKLTFTIFAVLRDNKPYEIHLPEKKDNKILPANLSSTTHI